MPSDDVGAFCPMQGSATPVILPLQRRPPGGRPTSCSGFSLVELIVVMTVLAVALVMYSTTVASIGGQQSIDRENVIAAEAARAFLEELRDEEFRTVFARYNADASDDPGGPGTAPGPRFAVEGRILRGQGERYRLLLRFVAQEG